MVLTTGTRDTAKDSRTLGRTVERGYRPSPPPISLMDYQFLSCTPVKDINWKLFETTTDEQTKLYDKIYSHHLVMKGYEPSVSYQLSFLKQWIVEKEKREVIEQVYELYTTLVSKSNYDNEYCYKSYYMGNSDRFVTLKECTALISNGTTGLRSWQGSMYLIEWITDNKDRFNNMHILELGSGIGLLGLSLLHITKPCSYTFTDCHRHVLDLLTTNIALNNHQNDNIQVIELDWTTFSATQYTDQVDIILATDVIYDMQLIDPFIHVLKTLLSGSSIAIVTSVIRNETTYSYFIKKLSVSCISYKEHNLSPNELFYFQRTSQVSILELTVSL